MINSDEIEKIKTITKELLDKMTIESTSIEIGLLDSQNSSIDAIKLDIHLESPQFVIGQNGQTLFEFERILRIILNKKLQNFFYVNLDINDYKKSKIEYLKDMAKKIADGVSLHKEKKILSPMPAYERRIIHAELSLRQDIMTESHGDGPDRHIVISPR